MKAVDHILKGANNFPRFKEIKENIKVSPKIENKIP